MSRRMSTFAAAMVIARRDFTALLMSRSFVFFLLGPVFMALVGVVAGSMGQNVQQAAVKPQLGVAMQASDIDAMVAARAMLAPQLGGVLPDLVVIERLGPDESFDPQAALASRRANIGAIVTGPLAAPTLSGTQERIAQWRGPVAVLAGHALSGTPETYPPVALSPTATSTARERFGRLQTAQAGQTLLFLLTMLLSGMVLSNLVEEKGNKIIEILAAAIPMDAVFFGKLVAMLGISLVGVAVWGFAGAGLALGAGEILPSLPEPAVGWPLFFGLGVIYFAMAYLLIGSIFLTIGSMAATVREVQTLSMPVTLLQLAVFFLAGYAVNDPGSPLELTAVIFPLSSPFAMLARAAQDSAVWTHLAALGWQAICVAAIVRFGARLFRARVMKSGSGGSFKPKRRWFPRSV